MIPVTETPALHASLIRGRLAVEEFIARRRTQLGDAAWDEEQATSRLLESVYPQVRQIEFNKKQEGGTASATGTGADWLWWWVDPTGAAFGMLVQAKNLVRKGKSWYVNFGYRDMRQVQDLHKASDKLNVPAVYALYCGDVAYRDGLTCGSSHSEDLTDRCRRSGVCLIPLLTVHKYAQLNYHDWPGDVGTDAYRGAYPLEDFADASVGPHVVYDLNLWQLDGQLKDFLARPQSGAKGVAKKIFRIISEMRQLQASAALKERTAPAAAAIFGQGLPADRGHFGVPYFDHVLRGLLHQPPDYVQELRSGMEPPTWLTELVAGVVLIEMT